MDREKKWDNKKRMENRKKNEDKKYKPTEDVKLLPMKLSQY